jgi:hypothetical protein
MVFKKFMYSKAEKTFKFTRDLKISRKWNKIRFF